MESWTYCNGEVVKEGSLFSLALRAMMFGEWTFTSFRMKEGKVFLFELHQDRLLKGLSYLYPHLEVQRMKAALEARILKSLSNMTQFHKGSYHVRLGLLYQDPNLDFLPATDQLPDVLCVLTSLKDSGPPLKVGLLEKEAIPWEDAGFKTSFYRDRLRDLRMFKLHTPVEDIVYVGPDGTLSDSTTSTFGLFKGDHLQFSPPSPVHFESISLQGPQQVLPVKLAPIKVTQLLEGKPFLVNSVRGICPIHKIYWKQDCFDFDVSYPIIEQYENFMSEKSKSIVQKMCVRCKEKPVVQSFRPFCSEKCKLIDLGSWLNESYRVPTKEVPEPDESDSESNEESNE